MPPFRRKFLGPAARSGKIARDGPFIGGAILRIMPHQRSNSAKTPDIPAACPAGAPVSRVLRPSLEAGASLGPGLWTCTNQRSEAEDRRNFSLCERDIGPVPYKGRSPEDCIDGLQLGRAKSISLDLAGKIGEAASRRPSRTRRFLEITGDRRYFEIFIFSYVHKAAAVWAAPEPSDNRDRRGFPGPTKAAPHVQIVPKSKSFALGEERDLRIDALCAARADIEQVRREGEGTGSGEVP